MKFFSTLAETLNERFDDISEVQDIVNHGITGGFNGFIYTAELVEFFDEFSYDIEDELEAIYGDDYLKELASNASSIDEMKQNAVWMVVEMWCFNQVDN